MDINKKSGQVEIKSPFGSVYLYTHDLAENLVEQVHTVMSRRLRWDDSDYLARMIFCKMVPKNQWNSSEKFGIGTQYYIDTNLLITLNIQTQMVHISSADITQPDYVISFEKFVTDYFRSAEL